MTRSTSFGQSGRVTYVDKIGRWMSTRRARSVFKKQLMTTAADVGCGYDAALGRLLFRDVVSVHLFDVSVKRNLNANNEFIHEGLLPFALNQIGDSICDAMLMNNVLEHLRDPDETLALVFLKLAPNGVLFLNVPTWRGKKLLEFLAFKLNLAPADEMNDHKTYYDMRSMWPMLVKAGFRPENIKIRTHKFGTNLYAICSKD